MVIQRKSKDCGVFAWHKLMNVPYDQALATLRRFGFSSTYGTLLEAWLFACERTGHHYEGIAFSGSTNDAGCLHNEGRFAVFVDRHVMALVDGVVWNADDCHMQMPVRRLIRIR